MVAKGTGVKGNELCYACWPVADVVMQPSEVLKGRVDAFTEVDA